MCDAVLACRRSFYCSRCDEPCSCLGNVADVSSGAQTMTGLSVVEASSIKHPSNSTKIATAGTNKSRAGSITALAPSCRPTTGRLSGRAVGLKVAEPGDATATGCLAACEMPGQCRRGGLEIHRRPPQTSSFRLAADIPTASNLQPPSPFASPLAPAHLYIHLLEAAESTARRRPRCCSINPKPGRRTDRLPRWDPIRSIVYLWAQPSGARRPFQQRCTTGHLRHLITPAIRSVDRRSARPDPTRSLRCLAVNSDHNKHTRHRNSPAHEPRNHE